MAKRAVDLSLEELAAMGANAALEAAQKAYDAGLNVVGTADFRDGDRVAPLLAERRPSGAVSAVGEEMVDGDSDISVKHKPEIGKSAD